MPEDIVGFVPAGGKGERLRPLTTTFPKPLLLMGSSEKRIIDYPLDSLTPVVSRTYITVGHGSYWFESLLGHSNTKILRDKLLLNIGGSFLQHLPELIREGVLGDTVIMVPGDHVVQGLDFQEMIRQHRQKKAKVTVGLVEGKRYGDYFLVDNEGQITNLDPNHTGNCCSGIFVMNSAFLIDRLQTMISRGWDDTPCDLTRDVIFPEIEKGMVYGYKFGDSTFWDDAGTFERYYANNMRLSSGNNIVSPTAQLASGVRLKRSIVLDWAYVSPDLHMENVVVPPLVRVRGKSDYVKINYNDGNY